MTRMPVTGFDELTFGPSKTLDLHGSQGADDAVRRAEAWLRERQMARAGDVLVITGRGRGSSDGVAVLRPAVEKLFTRLKRLGVVTGVKIHNEGSFCVTLAPVKALFEAPRRARATYPPATGNIPEFAGLSPDTHEALRQLAERTLEDLGARPAQGLVEDEMRRQLSLLAPGLPAGEDPDAALRRIAREVLDTMEAR